jgi:hypothetical protein
VVGDIMLDIMRDAVKSLNCCIFPHCSVSMFSPYAEMIWSALPIKTMLRFTWCDFSRHDFFVLCIADLQVHVGAVRGQCVLGKQRIVSRR